ncbi:hypothetical protein FSP39_003400 [Pinctada imbricata]|uniref:BED-type domain-containing protein n=1 Tax=Pinctada imbricata TaxID=66713 RepID=A0AA88YVF9_PINIB|nr:hypothetical protein FSP39_003400 [Pinctada imbricata]
MAEQQEDQGVEKLKDPPKSYRSKVWSYYGFRDSRDLKEKATCRLCFSDITCKTGSTSSMTHHLKRKHGIDLVQDTDKTSDLTGLSSSSSKADCNDIRPYSTVQSDAFKYMIKVLDPRYELPSRTYFSEKVMPEIYQTVVARVKTQLDKAPSVAITTDSWTSRATENFVAVTAHFINKNWDVENYTLQTKKFSESHTSVNLATGLDDVVSEWKLFRGDCKPAITTDNAQNIVNAANELQKILTIISTALTIEHQIEHRRTPSKLEVGSGAREE